MANHQMQVSVSLMPLEQFTFGLKDAVDMKDQSTALRLERMKKKFDAQGMRRSVDAVILVHQHNHPHVLILQQGQHFRLPGGRCKNGEGEIDCLRRKLCSKLAPPGYQTDTWDVVDTVATWYRPNFEALMYPYIPPHVTKPKETKKVYLVNAPQKFQFAVPKNMKLLAVPLFDLYENTRRYGSVLASLPQALSRYNMQCERGSY
eukprot:TRINITY_DN25014_c1_g1_i1.p2 TRINITY_DN25014_c1_g1~~TRINITY_DN25014_c1_g1_i1.p2  ORF type:complete len:204 (+),score=68.24 TRINITY_DN25014_c1_g1_i1:121-732(+)